jgi:hypothetical protein
MNKRRLLKLADLLEADAKNKKGIKFDLNGWGDCSDGEEVSLSCGTAACAMGLAVLSGAFKRAGLANASYDKSSILPAIGIQTGFDAARVLFDISWDDACFLFYAGNYPHTKSRGAAGEVYVAKRIRDFVAGKVSPEDA